MYVYVYVFMIRMYALQLTMGNMELSDDKSYRILDDDDDGDSDGEEFI